MVTVRSSEEDPLACLEGQIYRCLRIGPNPDVSPWIYSFVRDWESWPCVLSLCCEARCSDAAMEPEPEPVEEAEPPVDAEVEAKAAGEKKARPRACDPRSLCLAQSFCVRCCARLALSTCHSLANTGQSEPAFIRQRPFGLCCCWPGADNRWDTRRAAGAKGGEKRAAQFRLVRVPERDSGGGECHPWMSARP